MTKALVVNAGSKSGARALVAFTVAAVASSGCVGAAAGGFGKLFPPVSDRWLAFVVASAAYAMALVDTGRLPIQTPTLRRQTDPRWWYRFGPTRAAALWGFDLGLGFSTIRVSSLYWVVLVAAVALRSPLQGAQVFAMYGAGLAAAIAVGVFYPRVLGRRFAARVPGVGLQPTIRVLTQVSLFVWGGALAVSAVAAG